LAQHILAKEIVELAHGAEAAKKAEAAHKEAFSHGTNTFALGALRSALSSIKNTATPVIRPEDAVLLEYKKAYAASSTAQAVPASTQDQSKESSGNIVTLPLSMLQPGAFPRILHAAGLASSKSDAHRLIAKRGAYVVVPNSGSIETPTALQWINIETSATADPKHFLVDFDALVLRSGKSKIQICHIVQDEQPEGEAKAESEEVKA
jgi:tyrosyl-tRNA synthetase